MSLSYAAAPSPAANHNRMRQLTSQEVEVVALVVRGFKDGEIASRLGLAPAEAGRLVSSACEKLNASGRLELVVHAIYYGVATPR